MSEEVGRAAAARSRRENTGGIFAGIRGVPQKGTPLEVATQVMQYIRPVVVWRGEPLSFAWRGHRGKVWQPFQRFHDDDA